MKKYIPSRLLFLCICLGFTGCNTTSPEKYFDLAVLNSNMLSGFAGEGLLREFESPSVKMGANSQPVPMQRADVISTKIHFIQSDFEKLKELKESTDTKDMLQTSLALYEYVLPVYKTEYTQLAMLYDKGASKEDIQLLAQVIHDKYFLHYIELYNKLTNIGKLYAARHHIKVNWDVGL